VSHAIVLSICLVMVGSVARVDRTLHLNLAGFGNADALVITQGGEVGDVSLGRMSTIIKPVAVPMEAAAQHDPFQYTVNDGEDLKAVANKFQLSVEEVRWSNASLRNNDVVQKGDRLWLAPIHGVVYPFHVGDSIEAVAKTYNVAPTAIVDFNRIRDPEHMPEGTLLVIPNGKGPALFVPQPPPPAPVNYTVVGTVGSSVNNRFAYGYCTWYVASQKNVTWLGNAWEWYEQARALGLPVGQVPRVGAIYDGWDSGLGHVAIVIAVNANGSYRIREMNGPGGWGVITEREVPANSPRLIGFIYI
jgi:LysM repeat protein